MRLYTTRYRNIDHSGFKLRSHCDCNYCETGRKAAKVADAEDRARGHDLGVRDICDENGKLPFSHLCTTCKNASKCSSMCLDFLIL